MVDQMMESLGEMPEAKLIKALDVSRAVRKDCLSFQAQSEF